MVNGTMFLIVAACVIAALLALVAIVLVCRVSARISYAGKLYIDAYFGFLKFRLYPKEKREKKKSKKSETGKKASKKSNNNANKTNENEQQAEKNTASKGVNISDTANFIADIIKKVLQFLGKRARIEVDSLELIVSKKEAADTAVQFGLACGAVSTAIALCSEFGSYRINHKKVCVIPDFITGKSSVAVDITLSSRVIWILECGVKILYNKLISSERTAKK